MSEQIRVSEADQKVDQKVVGEFFGIQVSPERKAENEKKHFEDSKLRAIYHIVKEPQHKISEYSKVGSQITAFAINGTVEELKKKLEDAFEIFLQENKLDHSEVSEPVYKYKKAFSNDFEVIK